jgi:hypothetical protein
MVVPGRLFKNTDFGNVTPKPPVPFCRLNISFHAARFLKILMTSLSEISWINSD